MKIFRFIYILSLFVLSCFAFDSSATVANNVSWTLTKSKITYQINYTFKSFAGAAASAKGKGVCKENKCEVLVGVPIKDFDSNDSNRDSRMLEVTKGLLHPIITFKISTTTAIDSDFTSDVEISFAGKTKKYENVRFKIINDNENYLANSKFDILLEDFYIDRPKLLGIPIDNKVPISIESTWKKNLQ